jgi:hypothetical protein
VVRRRGEVGGMDATGPRTVEKVGMTELFAFRIETK